MKRFKLYKVGGCVRDSILGESPKDIDFVFEFTQDFLDSVILKDCLENDKPIPLNY